MTHFGTLSGRYIRFLCYMGHIRAYFYPNTDGFRIELNDDNDGHRVLNFDAEHIPGVVGAIKGADLTGQSWTTLRVDNDRGDTFFLEINRRPGGHTMLMVEGVSAVLDGQETLRLIETLEEAFEAEQSS